ncbi:MAG TPA: hypothetical protein VJP79_09815 [Nitrososphaera sp.]|nr:hypothetical protein [Nitrososphaera sp.]
MKNNSSIATNILASTLEVASSGASRAFLLQNIDGMNEKVADWAIMTLVKDDMLMELSDGGRTHVAYRTTEKGIGYLRRQKSESVTQSLIMAA